MWHTVRYLHVEEVAAKSKVNNRPYGIILQ